MFLFREVRQSDLADLELLAARLNTLNLPANTETLKKIIAKSHDSFCEKNEGTQGEFVFVLRDIEKDRVIGTCMIIAQHGTYERPAVYFNQRKEERYSPHLQRHFIHQLLELSFNYDGPTEIGGLILHPDYRGHALRLGKLLAFVRFLYMGMRPELFRDEVVAELLPPLNEDGTSSLWDALGYQFTGIDYMQADKLSRENVDFIRRLFPTHPIYITLLPNNVKERIGAVGKPTLPVKKMLESIGFEYDQSIDPFDGGPTFRVRVRDCEAIRRVSWETFLGKYEGADSDGMALIGFEYGTEDQRMKALKSDGEEHVRFRAAFGAYKRTPHGIAFHGKDVDNLRMEIGEKIGFLPFTGPDLHPL